MFSQAESFLFQDKQGAPEEDRRIQRPKRSEKNNKDKDNSPKTLTNKNNSFFYKSLPLPMESRRFCFRDTCPSPANKKSSFLVAKDLNFESPFVDVNIQHIRYVVGWVGVHC